MLQNYLIGHFNLLRKKRMYAILHLYYHFLTS